MGHNFNIVKGLELLSSVFSSNSSNNSIKSNRSRNSGNIIIVYSLHNLKNWFKKKIILFV